MKRAWIYLAIFSVLLSSIVYAASIDVVEKVGSFACTVLYDENPVKEIDGVAVIPFGSEYKILLKNNNNRKAVAKITIDGAPISSFGDLVINTNSEIILERFITKSLDKGERFKFVPLDHPDVDDPSRIENGIIKVEFRLAKKQEYIQFDDRWYLPLLDQLTIVALVGHYPTNKLMVREPIPERQLS